MPFKIKDLMIHVLDPKAVAPGLCRVPSVQCTAIISVCTAIRSHCHFPHSICPPITYCETLPTFFCHHPFTAVCPGGTVFTGTICINPSNCGAFSCGVVSPCAGGSCGAVPSICAGGSIIPDPTIVENPDPTAGLAALKEQLKQAMANVETQEAALNDSLLPQTVAEADDLEKRLTGALEALKAHKANLQKSETKK